MQKVARVWLALVLFSLGLVASAGSPTASQAAGVSDIIPGQYIVVFKDNVSDVNQPLNRLVTALGVRLIYTYTSALKGFAATIPDAALNIIKADPAVSYVVPDKIVSLIDKPGDVKAAAAQVVPTGIKRINADLSSQKAGNGSGAVTNVAVAVIDTGIDSSHPDLNVVGGYNCTTFGLFTGQWKDQNGHGTHVSGTIGAKDDSSGVVGVAPGVPLYAVRVLNAAGSGTSSSVICGIDWVTKNAAAKNIKVANMSLGGSGADDGNCGRTNNDPQHTAVCNLVNSGVTLAVAAGNDTADASTSTPAAYDEAITVSALADFNGLPGGGGASTCYADVDDTFADFSNYGADVDIIAPGVCIYSTWLNGGFNTISGTSMATPHVTGAATLYISTHPGATPTQVKAALQNAGNSNWNNADDHDSTKEVLLDVSTF